MVSTTSAFRLCSILALGAILACTESSRRPPTAPLAVFALRLELIGPTTVHLGKTAQYRAIAQLSDNTTKDVTNESTWSTAQSSVLAISSTGIAQGRANGEVSVSVSKDRQRATISNVIVVPEGTFRLRGTVRDEGLPVDAIVRIEDQASGGTEVPAVRGEYVAYGVAGQARVTVIKDGYGQQPRTVEISDHMQLDLDVVPSRPRADVSGVYRLSITASDACTTLPDDVRVRSYDALVEQSGPGLTVTLSGAQFRVERGETLNRFKGQLEVDRAVFALSKDFYYYYYYTPDVFEILAPDRGYWLEGTVVAAAVATGFSGTLSGTIRVEGGFPNSAACKAPNHGFVLAR